MKVRIKKCFNPLENSKTMSLMLTKCKPDHMEFIIEDANFKKLHQNLLDDYVVEDDKNQKKRAKTTLK